MSQDNPVVTRTVELWDRVNETWNYTQQQRSEFSAQGLKTSQVDYDWDMELIQWNRLQRFFYSHDTEDRLSLVESNKFDDELGNWETERRVEKRWEYNSNGCLIEEYDRSSYYGAFNFSSSFVYSSQYLTKQFEVDTDCQVQVVYHYGLDVNQFAAVDSVFNNPQKEFIKRYEYFDGTPSTEYYAGPQYTCYDEKGRVIATKKINPFIPNKGYPDSAGVWYNYEYDERDNVIGIEFFAGRRGGLCRNEFLKKYKLTYDDQDRLIIKDLLDFDLNGMERIRDRIIYSYYACTSLVKTSTKVFMIPRIGYTTERISYTYLNPVDCDEPVETAVLLTPNPILANNYINITSDLLLAGDAVLNVFDTSGKLIFQKAHPELACNYSIKISSGLQGLYLVHISSSLGEGTAKLSVF